MGAQYQAMTIRKKLGSAAQDASDLAAIRKFVATVDQGRRPRVEELRVVANILRRATNKAKKRGPKSYFDLFGASSFDSPRAIRYLEMLRATKSGIATGKSQSRAIALAAEQMDVSTDTVFRVWKAYNEYMQLLESIISEKEKPRFDDELDDIIAALVNREAQNLKG
jgi:hypothetical protein